MLSLLSRNSTCSSRAFFETAASRDIGEFDPSSTKYLLDKKVRRITVAVFKAKELPILSEGIAFFELQR